MTVQTIRNAAAVFCIACICAELVCRLVGSGWEGRCIKTLAGLYILVVLFRMIPEQLPAVSGAELVAGVPAELGSPEQIVLSETETRLEAQAAEQCLAGFGVFAQVELRLKQENGEVRVGSLTVVLPAGTAATVHDGIRAELEQTFGVSPLLTEGNADE